MSEIALRDYLNDIRQIKRTKQAVPETSYYGKLESLLNAIGAELKPAVFCVINLQNRGAGIPDGGFFLKDDEETPARGVIEVKSTGDDVLKIAESEQVEKYLKRYGQVLVTNYYQFVLVTRSAAGVRRISEPYSLAATEADFWQTGVKRMVDEHAAGLTLFLQHAMLLPAPISEPKELANALAYYARYTKARIERDDVDLSVLETVKKQLEDALGVRFERETGDEFFRSTLVQTLFYGIFSAWVLWHESDPPAGETFALWRHIRDLNVPAIQELFEQVTAPSRLRPLHIEEVLERTADTLNRVSPAFFDAFEKGEAVQYFYEPFLEAFDPRLREQLGVWYTPPQVVKYMVGRVDAALRDELGIEDGLMSEQVYVLDPCCGTGAYLVEVLRHIHRKAEAREGALMAGQIVQRALVGEKTRVFGFELLPAPFVIAHLQIGLLLRQMHAPVPEGKRAGVYLTNALTGWDEAPKTQVMFPELAKERDAASSVKQHEPILVILGNPPYSGYAGIAIAEERDLTHAYRSTENAPRPQGQGLNDLYVRFYRMAERKITERTGRGIVCYISNYSWLDGLSHPGMRESYLDKFDSISIDSLNGDKYRTGKVIPAGQPGAGQADPSIFTTPFNREGIQVGTAIATLVRRDGEQHGTDWVRFRDLWGRDKLTQLATGVRSEYETLSPDVRLGFPFTTRLIGKDYLNWPKMPELFPVSYPGVTTARDSMVIDIDRDSLVNRLKHYFDPGVSHGEMAKLEPSVMQETSRFQAEQTREYMLNRHFVGLIVRHYYRPFDVRWLYWDYETKLLDEKRSDYFPHVRRGNIFLVTTGRTRKLNIEPGVTVTTLHDYNSMDSGARAFPLYLYNQPDDNNQPQQQDMFAEAHPERRPNLSKKAEGYLFGLGEEPEALFYHALAVMHAPQYRQENAGALRQDWPRIPLPDDRDALERSAALGRQVAALLDVERDVPGVTAGEVREDLRPVAVLTTTDNGDPDFKLDGWGYLARGATMPKSGTVSANDDGGLDVYLNATTYWADVPAAVWAYTLGGYQVLKKWLSYRDAAVLGRPLRADEVRTFMHIARRIAAILALESALDENYAALG